MTAMFLILDGLSRTLRYFIVQILPLRERLRLTGWRAGVFLGLCTVLATALTMLLMFLLPNRPQERFLCSCFGQLCSLLVFLLVVKGPIFPLLLLAFLQVCYGDNLKLVVRVVELCVYPEGFPGPAGDICSLVLTVLTLPVMYAVVRTLICPVLDKTGRQSFWRLLWQIPAVSYLIFRFSVYPSYFYSDGRLSFPWNLLLLVWPLVTALVFYVILRLVRAVTDRLTLAAKLEEEHALLAILEEAYQQQQREMDKARVVRHDMRHHLLAVRRLLASGHTGEAGQYLSDCIQRMEEEESGSKGAQR